MGQQRTESGDPKAPHVFQPVELLPMSAPISQRGLAPGWAPPPTPAGKSQICGLCRKPRGDRIHLEGEAQADAESPRWG